MTDIGIFAPEQIMLSTIVDMKRVWTFESAKDTQEIGTPWEKI